MPIYIRKKNVKILKILTKIVEMTFSLILA